MRLSYSWFRHLALACIAMGFLGVAVVAGTVLYLKPSLPSVDSLRDTRLQTPLRIYSSDGVLIGEFGEQRRSPISFEQIPDHFIHAILAAEDDNFYGHSGVDLMGLARAASQIVTTGGIQTGGSTITMQVARNFFLTLDQTFTRKFNEILLALQIEHELSKEEILALYANKIYLGKSAYGVEAAAQVYYGKNVNQLSLAQLAMIAGLPKAPSTNNPVNNPQRALERRNWILGRMQHLGYISNDEYTAAIQEPVTAEVYATSVPSSSQYAAEMARLEALERFGNAAYTEGYKVYTTIDSTHQLAADRAVKNGLYAYDARHGYRGAERQFSEPEINRSGSPETLLSPIRSVDGLIPALVSDVSESSALIWIKGEGPHVLEWDDGLSEAAPRRSQSWVGSAPSSAEQVVQIGDVIRVKAVGERWQLTQLPNAQGALVALDPMNGAIRAITGGYDYNQSKFNRILDALRQPGSNLKPFLYATALENGFTPSSLVNDAPIVIDGTDLEQDWRPENDSGKFYGPTPLRTALYLSRNLVSIRILQSIGLETATQGIAHFGFEPDDLAPNLTLALGSQGVIPLKIARGYAAFANGGYLVDPYLVQYIEDVEGNRIYEAQPPTVCSDRCQARVARADTQSNLGYPLASNFDSLDSQQTPPPLPTAPRVLDERIAYMMDSILKDVIAKGTATRAQVLGRSDIGGKTGTTNGPRDAWFSGYSPTLVATAWVGFDDNSVLGSSEFGGTAALPIWIEYMQTALENEPEIERERPNGIVTARIDPTTGLRTTASNPNGVYEIFLRENTPPILDSDPSHTTPSTEDIAESIF